MAEKDPWRGERVERKGEEQRFTSETLRFVSATLQHKSVSFMKRSFYLAHLLLIPGASHTISSTR